MGIKLFSSDSRDYGPFKSPGVPVIEPPTVVRVNSTPDPTRFTIVRKTIENGYPILWVHYPDVENYEGNKILMYDKDFDLELIKDRIDPHFFNKGDSPIARFVPTGYGLGLAVTLAHKLP